MSCARGIEAALKADSRVKAVGVSALNSSAVVHFSAESPAGETPIDVEELIRRIEALGFSARLLFESSGEDAEMEAAGASSLSTLHLRASASPTWGCASWREARSQASLLLHSPDSHPDSPLRSAPPKTAPSVFANASLGSAAGKSSSDSGASSSASPGFFEDCPLRGLETALSAECWGSVAALAAPLARAVCAGASSKTLDNALALSSSRSNPFNSSDSLGGLVEIERDKAAEWRRSFAAFLRSVPGVVSVEEPSSDEPFLRLHFQAVALRRALGGEARALLRFCVAAGWGVAWGGGAAERAFSELRESNFRKKTQLRHVAAAALPTGLLFLLGIISPANLPLWRPAAGSSMFLSLLGLPLRLWMMAVLALAVVFSPGGRVLQRRALKSVVEARSPGMPFLVALGADAALVYSLAACLIVAVNGSPDGAAAEPPLFFDTAAALVFLQLLGALLELHAKGEAAAFAESLGSATPRAALLLAEAPESSETPQSRLPSLTPASLKTLVESPEILVPTELLEAGDVVRVFEGEVIPADGLFLGLVRPDFAFRTCFRARGREPGLCRCWRVPLCLPHRRKCVCASVEAERNSAM